MNGCLLQIHGPLMDTRTAQVENPPSHIAMIGSGPQTLWFFVLPFPLLNFSKLLVFSAVVRSSSLESRWLQKWTNLCWLITLTGQWRQIKLCAAGFLENFRADSETFVWQGTSWHFNRNYCQKKSTVLFPPSFSLDVFLWEDAHELEWFWVLM